MTHAIYPGIGWSAELHGCYRRKPSGVRHDRHRPFDQRPASLAEAEAQIAEIRALLTWPAMPTATCRHRPPPAAAAAATAACGGLLHGAPLVARGCAGAAGRLRRPCTGSGSRPPENPVKSAPCRGALRPAHPRMTCRPGSATDQRRSQTFRFVAPFFIARPAVFPKEPSCNPTARPNSSPSHPPHPDPRRGDGHDDPAAQAGRSRFTGARASPSTARTSRATTTCWC